MEPRVLEKPSRRNLSLLKLNDLLENGSVYLNAPYQRGIVWGQNEMSDLIESVFQDIFIPPILFSNQEVQNGKMRVCIDGKQRLTTIYRFMKNEIPYLDRSGGVVVRKYYSQALDEKNANIASIISQTPRKYLTQQETSKFNKFEIMCTDYKNLTEDEEYEMFLRVNQGQAFSTDEKLRAHNTPIAKIVRQLADDYANVSSILVNQSPAHRFRFISEVLCHLRNGPSQFNQLASDIERFICEKGDYPPLLLDNAKRALSILITMMGDEQFVTVLNQHPLTGGKTHATRIELLIFTYYLCLRTPHIGISDLSEDFRSLRVHIRESGTGRADLTRANWMKGMDWCQERLHEKEAAIQQQQQLQLQLQHQRYNSRSRNNVDEESEVDELKSDDDDSEGPTEISAQSNRGGNSKVGLQGIGRGARKPTARRGGRRAPRPE